MNKLYRKHRNCECQVIHGPFGPHYAKLVCKKHNKVLQWLNQRQADRIAK